MTALTAPTVRPAAAGPAARTARRLVRAQLLVGRWFWAIVLVGAVVASVVVHRNGNPDLSVVAQARQAGIWFPFSMHVVVATSVLAPHLAAGMTRRSYVRGALTCAVVIAALYAALMTAALLVERVWYQSNDWAWSLQVLALSSDQPQVGLIFVDHALMFLVANLSGLLVGAVYQAHRGWWGTLTLPLTVGPIVLTGGLLADDLLPWATDVIGGTAGVVACVLLLAVATGAAFAAVARRTAITRPPA